MHSADYKNIAKGLTEYYHDKLREHGATAQGVGWKDDNAQFVRFEQLLKVLKKDNGFVINELGCGYGMLYEYMRRTRYRDFKYVGYDLSPQMIRKAKSSHKGENCGFRLVKNASELKKADYTVASGIFNLRMEFSYKEWYQYIIDTLDSMDHASEKGFSFNCLTKYSDKPLMRKELFYADPCKLFDHCKRQYSRNVALLHDYDIYDFTILVRKD